MLSVDVVSVSNEPVGKVELAEEVFGVSSNPHLLTEIVNWQRAKRRAGTQSTKTKGEVAKTKAKPHRQKGTGRARQGSNANPHMRGGGVALGPKPRSYDYKVPSSKRRVALATALSTKLSEGNLIILDGLNFPEVKTKKASEIKTAFGSYSSLFVDVENHAAKLSIRNIEKAKFVSDVGVHVYDILKYEKLMMTKTAAIALQDRLIGMFVDEDNQSEGES